MVSEKTTKQPCHRCSDCQGMSHHWMTNPRIGISEVDSTHVCKHCPAKGQECPACVSGYYQGPRLGNEQCGLCKGEGVLRLSKYLRLQRASTAAVETIIRQWDSWEEEAGREAQSHQLDSVAGFVMEAKLRTVIEDAIAAFLQ